MFCIFDWCKYEVPSFNYLHFLPSQSSFLHCVWSYLLEIQRLGCLKRERKRRGLSLGYILLTILYWNAEGKGKLSEAERQVKRVEAARRRKQQVEKTARDIQVQYCPADLLSLTCFWHCTMLQVLSLH